MFMVMMMVVLPSVGVVFIWMWSAWMDNTGTAWMETTEPLGWKIPKTIDVAHLNVWIENTGTSWMGSTGTTMI